jgi:rod shape-determining protein MreC
MKGAFMKRKENFLPAFLVVFFLCVLILTLSLSGNLKFLSSFLEKGTTAVQSATFGIWQKLPFVSEDPRLKKLEEKNLELLSQVTVFEKLKRENAALLDQFQTAYPQSAQLLKADIIGASSFVPGVSVPNVFIIDKGLKDNLKVGMAVVIKDNLVGVISQVSDNLSEVNIINNSLSSFTAKTQNGTVGIVKGGASLTLDNILLSENIKEGETVLTKGSINSDGVGIPQDLIVGKIISVEKKPSDLFQKAKIESFVNFINLSTVFVYTQIK